MFQREANVKSKVCQIGNVKVGGQPGENPPPLIGGIFYAGHKIVEKPRKDGKFNREKAETLIKRQEELSDQTGVSSMVDIVAFSPQEFERFIDFVSKVTDMPIWVDAWKVPVKIAGARYTVEVGLNNRVVYNSLAPWSEDIGEEVAEIKRLGLESGVVVAYNKEDKSVEGRLTILKDKLLPYAQKAGFKNILVDTCVINLPSLAFTLKANLRIKKDFGIPVGCGTGNAADSWKELRQIWWQNGYIGVDAASQALATLFWSDFILYGPLENAPWVFPAAAAANAILSTLVYEKYKILPSEVGHPLNRLFPDFVKELAGSCR